MSSRDNNIIEYFISKRVRIDLLVIFKNIKVFYVKLWGKREIDFVEEVCVWVVWWSLDNIWSLLVIYRRLWLRVFWFFDGDYGWKRWGKGRSILIFLCNIEESEY